MMVFFVWLSSHLREAASPSLVFSQAPILALCALQAPLDALLSLFSCSHPCLPAYPPGIPFSSVGSPKHSFSPLPSAYLKWQNILVSSPGFREKAPSGWFTLL